MFYNYVRRTNDIQFLLNHQHDRTIKFLTGFRRSGKTTLLSQLKQLLKERGIEDKQLISIDLEDYHSVSMRNPQVLHQHILSQLDPRTTSYLFLDEVQHVDHYERLLEALYYEKNLDLYVTGSNQYLLNGEEGELLDNKYSERTVLPLSFNEYLVWHKDNHRFFSMEALFTQYTISSLPFTVFLNSEKERLDYSLGVYSTLLLNDIVRRLNVKDITILEELIAVLFRSIGELLTVNKLKAKMTHQKTPMAYNTIDRYIGVILESGLMYRARRYDIQSMQVLRTQEKYFAVDVGLAFHAIKDASLSQNQIIENIIYLELLRRGYQVYVGKSNQYKVSFVGIDEEAELAYYQFTPSIRDKSVLERDLAALRSIRDYYPKYLLTLDPTPKTVNFGGIKCINVMEWLVE